MVALMATIFGVGGFRSGYRGHWSFVLRGWVDDAPKAAAGFAGFAGFHTLKLKKVQKNRVKRSKFYGLLNLYGVGNPAYSANPAAAMTTLTL
jgi:hypothetical protein